MNYFAYGSNLHPYRLAKRIGPVRVGSVAALSEASLRFHKRGRDGSGKCSLSIPSPQDRVFGVVYGMTQAQQASLNEFEDIGRGYAQIEVSPCALDGREFQAFTYVAVPTAVDESLRPFDWYKQLVLLGMRHHGFPKDYVRRVDRVESLEDPDSERREQYESLVLKLSQGSD